MENLYLKEYFDYNFTAFYEEISSIYDISYDVILNAFKKDDIISPISHKNTIKSYNERMKNATENLINNEKIELYKSRSKRNKKIYTTSKSSMEKNI